ncbi:MAG: UDP-N-acetylglucosamine 2-epimerase (hydrolyzing), partial [Flavobacteriaceae bacterium]|nr:UDP-N-acetylglucosamine 2-epimerase (hydrolyzing) [Flavobacteriaceae bacterium]
NIGTRQNRRLRGSNVLDVSYEKKEIFDAITSQIAHPKNTASTIYGEGDSGKKIADILAEIKLRFHKTISY